jgi:hypothetical protein
LKVKPLPVKALSLSSSDQMASLSLSPFLAALPLNQHIHYEYDEDGDVIMTDAQTGSPIRYGYGSWPQRSEAPPAPIRAPRPLIEEDEDEKGLTPVRNLAVAMAEAALEPPFIYGRIEDNPHGPAPFSAPPAGASPEADAGAASEEEEAPEWCLSVAVPDLSLRLDMRHPRVILNFLRFVSTYNELAPEGEDIHLPAITTHSLDYIRNHESVRDPVPEFQAEVSELLTLLDQVVPKA